MGIIIIKILKHKKTNNFILILSANGANDKTGKQLSKEKKDKKILQYCFDMI